MQDDPLLPCAACRHELHGACMGWWDWCPCDCGLISDDPRTNPINQPQGEP